MEKQPLPNTIPANNSYLELAIYLVAGTAAAIFISWALSYSSLLFPGIKIPTVQALLVSGSPFFVAVAKWCAGRVSQLQQKVEANALQLTELKEAKETIARLDRELIWATIQIEVLFSNLDEQKKGK